MRLLLDGEPHPDDFQCDYLGLVSLGDGTEARWSRLKRDAGDNRNS
jgi:hypothetical protein